jgi:hypothetical protein
MTRSHESRRGGSECQGNDHDVCARIRFLDGSVPRRRRSQQRASGLGILRSSRRCEPARSGTAGQIRRNGIVESVRRGFETRAGTRGSLDVTERRRSFSVTEGAAARAVPSNPRSGQPQGRKVLRASSVGISWELQIPREHRREHSPIRNFKYLRPPPSPKWRREEGVEPSIPCETGRRGFEDRPSHRARSLSVASRLPDAP